MAVVQGWWEGLGWDNGKTPLFWDGMLKNILYFHSPILTGKAWSLVLAVIWLVNLLANTTQPSIAHTNYITIINKPRYYRPLRLENLLYFL